MTEAAGLLDLTGFTRFELSGEGASEWLDGMITGLVPRLGRVSLAYLCAESGRVITELTVTRLEENRFWLIGPAAGYWHDRDWLQQHLPQDGSVVLEDITARYGTLVLAGPKSRDVLSKLTRTSLSNDDFKWLTGKKISVGHATANALRVNFVGELGWELHHPIEQQNAIFDAVMEAGEEFGIKPFGIRAMTAMAVEKSYRLIPRELSIEYNAFESGLDRFVKLKESEGETHYKVLLEELEMDLMEYLESEI